MRETETEFDFGEEVEGCKVVQVWCMDYVDNLIGVGCANGQIEFWEGTTGKLKVKGFLFCSLRDL